MGHANINTTMIYAHHAPKYNVADALTRLIDKAGAPTRSRADSARLGTR
jgi:integrase